MSTARATTHGIVYRLYLQDGNPQGPPLAVFGRGTVSIGAIRRGSLLQDTHVLSLGEAVPVCVQILRALGMQSSLLSTTHHDDIPTFL